MTTSIALTAIREMLRDEDAEYRKCPLRCQCGQMINDGLRVCPLPRGKRCEHLIGTSSRAKASRKTVNQE